MGLQLERNLPDPIGAAQQKSKTTPDERRRSADQALADMKQATEALRNQRKGNAAQRMDQIKREIEALRRFPGGDPKGLAREAARLARELASAAKDYGAGATGGDSPGGDAEAKFAADARELARRIRVLAEEQRRKAAGDDDVERHAYEVERALGATGSQAGFSPALPAAKINLIA